MSNPPLRFDSSLARRSQVMTAVVLGVLVLVATLLVLQFVRVRCAALLWSVLGIVPIALVTLYLVVQAPHGLQVDGQELRVVRRIGARTISLTGLRASREVGPLEMRGLVRRFGVGGFLGWWGSFRSIALGDFQLYATRLDRLVLLEFEDRKVVVSVNDPGALLRELRGSSQVGQGGLRCRTR